MQFKTAFLPAVLAGLALATPPAQGATVVLKIEDGVCKVDFIHLMDALDVNHTDCEKPGHLSPGLKSVGGECDPVDTRKGYPVKFCEKTAMATWYGSKDSSERANVIEMELGTQLRRIPVGKKPGTLKYGKHGWQRVDK